MRGCRHFSEKYIYVWLLFAGELTVKRVTKQISLLHTKKKTEVSFTVRGGVNSEDYGTSPLSLCFIMGKNMERLVDLTLMYKQKCKYNLKFLDPHNDISLKLAITEWWYPSPRPTTDHYIYWNIANITFLIMNLILIDSLLVIMLSPLLLDT